MSPPTSPSPPAINVPTPTQTTKFQSPRSARRESLYGRKNSTFDRSSSKSFSELASPFSPPSKVSTEGAFEGDQGGEAQSPQNGSRAASDEEKSLAILRARNGVSTLGEYFHGAPNKHDIPDEEKPGEGRVKRMSMLYGGEVAAGGVGGGRVNRNFEIKKGGGLSFTKRAASGSLGGSEGLGVGGQRSVSFSVEERGGGAGGDGAGGAAAPQPPPTEGMLMPFTPEGKRKELLTPGELEGGGEGGISGNSNGNKNDSNGRRKSILSLSDYLSPSVNPPEPTSTGATPSSTTMVDPLRSSTLSRSHHLRDLKEKLRVLSDGNASAVTQLLLMVYKLDCAPLPSHHYNAIKELGIKGADKIKRAGKGGKSTRTVLDMLGPPMGGRPLGAPALDRRRTRRVVKGGEGGRDNGEWTAQGTHTSPTRGGGGRTGGNLSPTRQGTGNEGLSAVNEFLRKEALSEGEKLYEKEYGRGGKYGKSLWLAESMRKAKDVVDAEREKRAMEERMKAVSLKMSQRGTGRNRTDSYFNSIDREVFVKGMARMEAEKAHEGRKREVRSAANVRTAEKTNGGKGKGGGERKRSITFSPDTKRVSVVAVKMDTSEAAEYLRWKQERAGK
ncbi:hypothetical protein TrRE_jg4382 [Triparma retinervis]|uniref:Uncharacterized protein n=1 Tax=Triparma retinervis TaxID=2557542 RepID=A0A9W6Z9Y3_9STRA|nr:hypothetical protein TrRE_jg4382 [Triparma retinervis]